MTGSANYSDNSTIDNEENTILLVGSRDESTKRVADIYLTEYHRLFMHFVFRDLAARDPSTASAGPGTARLVEGDSWTKNYYEVGSWKARQRQTFAGTA